MLIIDEADRNQAARVVAELRDSADKLALRAQQLAEEAVRLRQRADDIEQLIRQSGARG